jgi:hypothetical protein
LAQESAWVGTHENVFEPLSLEQAIIGPLLRRYWSRGWNTGHFNDLRLECEHGKTG